MWGIIIIFQQSGLAVVFEIIPSYMQWVAALVIHLTRIINCKILSKLMFKMTGRHGGMVHFAWNTALTTHYSLFVAITLVNVNDITAIILLGVETLVHIRKCYQIIKLDKTIRACKLGGGNRELLQKTLLHSLYQIAIFALLDYLDKMLSLHAIYNKKLKKSPNNWKA